MQFQTEADATLMGNAKAQRDLEVDAPEIDEETLGTSVQTILTDRAISIHHRANMATQMILSSVRKAYTSKPQEEDE